MLKTVYHFVIFSLLLTATLSCDSNSDNIRLKELELRNKELELKERELNVKELETQRSIESEKSKQLLLAKELEEKPKEFSLSELYEECVDAVFFVFVLDEKDELLGSGSAFVIASSGLAVSNYHVFEGASKVMLMNKKGDKYMVTEIVKASKEQDFVIFKMDNHKNLSFLSVSDSTPKIGEKSFAIGNPKGMARTSFTLSEGIISGLRVIEGTHYLQTTAEITHGSSGGPLINSLGKVVGITTRGFEEANLNFCVDIRELDVSNELTKLNISNSNQLESITPKEIIEHYYKSILEENWDELEKLYTSKLNRFFDSFDLSKEEAVQNARNYKKWFGVIDYKLKVRWDTFEQYESGGSWYLNYKIDLDLNRKDKSKKSKFVLEMKVVLDSNGKVESIYENILSKF